MAIEINLQGFLHGFEQGRAAVWVRRIVVAVIVALLAMMWFVFKFNGFSAPAAMDQAQVGRQLAGGQGFSTLYARPLAMHLGLARTGRLGLPLREVSQAPLGPVLNAIVFRLSGMNFNFEPGEVVSPAERVITAAAFLFFAGSLVLSYLLGRRLFDPSLALLGIGLLIVTDLVWRFTFSGLPQMAMLFFFSGALLALLAALEAGEAQKHLKSFLLVLLASLLLSFVTLGNGIGLWIFAGFWLFAVTMLRPRWLVALTAPVVYALPLLPWAWHNWRAIRNPFGLPFYELYRPPGTDPLALVADLEPILRFKPADFLANTAAQTLEQLSNLFTYFGGSIVAAAFFAAVFLHVFRQWQPAQFRWAVLLMWFGAATGMAVFGVDAAVSVNQLHILFLPVMMFYGLAFLLVLWSRLGFDQPVLRGAFLIFLYLTAAVPLLGTVFSTAPRVNWPPYLPPLVTRFSEWVEPGEALASDIPWATAWYANRLSLLLPENIGQFEIIHSEGLLGAPLVGIYLTPFSGDQPAYARIINGRYREWARFVLREIKQEDLANWMLRSAVNLPIEGQSIFFADRPRWR
jgi:hypothetical protein